MVSRIEVIPSEVRGYGDIVSPKTLDDFELWNSALELTDGVYTLTYNGLSITLAAEQVDITYGESAVLTATVLNRDAPVIGQTVTLYESGNVVETSETDSDGEATFTVGGLSIGTYGFKASVGIVESNTVTVTVNALLYDGVELSSDKSILSYYNSESATLSAQLMDGDDLAYVEGVTIEFFKGSTSMGTSQTNSQGLATKTYASEGTGDITITAEVDSITDTCNIEDCIYYSTSETECTNTNNYITIADLSSITLPSNFELSMDYKTNYEARCGLFNKSTFSGNPNYSVFIGSPSTTGSSWYYGYRTTSTSTTDISFSATDYHTYTITRNGNTFYYKRDSTNVNKSVTWFDSYNYVIGIMMWGTGKYSYVKNIKLKAL